MRLSPFCFTLLAAVCFLSEGRGDDPIVSLSELRVGDVVPMNYSRRGCFSEYECDLTFRRSTNTVVTIDEIEYGPWEAGKESARIRHRLGEMTLSEADVTGLDRLLQRFRAKSGGGGTTREWISVAQLRGDAVTAAEELGDGVRPGFRNDELHIGDLLARLKFPGKPESTYRLSK